MPSLARLRPVSWLLIFAVMLAFAAVGVARASGASAATQLTLYASPTGSGSACSSSAPCALTEARGLVESMNGSMTGDIVVYLMGGTYRLSSTFQLGPQDSGSNGYTVDWEAYPGQTPVIDGVGAGHRVVAVQLGADIWRAGVPAGTQSPRPVGQRRAGHGDQERHQPGRVLPVRCRRSPPATRRTCRGAILRGRDRGQQLLAPAALPAFSITGPAAADQA